MIRTIEAIEILVEDGKGEWARVRLEEHLGIVTIISSFGEWAHQWPPQRAVCLAELLSGGSFRYLGKKMLGENFEVYDEPGTIAAVVKFLQEEDLTDEEISKEEYLVDDLEERGFEWWGWETDLDNPSEFHMTKPDESWTNFWEQLWKPLILPDLAQVVGIPRRSTLDRLREAVNPKNPGRMWDPSVGVWPIYRDDHAGEIILELVGEP